jgi:hypothetical protein
MKKKILAGIAVAGVVLLMAGCDDAGYNMLLRAAMAEASTLKSFCDQNNLKSEEISRADSLLASAAVKQQSNLREDAFMALDLSIIYYRLALSKNELVRTEKIVEDARQKLSDDGEQLNTNEKVLSELKGERK